MSILDFFRKRRAAAPAPDIEEIIWRIAENRQLADEELLWRLMQGRTVYVPTDPSSLPADAAPGEKYRITASDRVQMRCKVGPGDRLFTCAATRPDSALLSEGHVEMDWREFLQMTAKLGAEFGGFLLQGQRSWVGLDRARIDALLRAPGA